MARGQRCGQVCWPPGVRREFRRHGVGPSTRPGVLRKRTRVPELEGPFLLHLVPWESKQLQRAGSWASGTFQSCLVPGRCSRSSSVSPSSMGYPGVTRFTHMGDFMHGGDIGTSLHLHGFTLDHVTRDGGPYAGRSRAERTRACWSDLLTSYTATAVSKRLQTITPEMIDGQSGYPCLSAKAAESRHLMRPMLHLLERTLSNSDFDLHIIEAYRNMCEVNDIVVSGGIALTDAESTN
jgi:hypothetical protein